MRIEELFCHHVTPETKISREDIAQEVAAAHAGHLEAEATKYRCTAEELDRVLGGAGHFITIANSYYDYAVEGVLDTAHSATRDGEWLDFASFLNQSHWEAEFHGANYRTTCTDKLFKLGAIRARLDEDTLGDAATNALPHIFHDQGCGYLTLGEIAVLAQMNEKSVRNATQPKAPDRLHTRKEGTRTVVDSHEALRWLKGRRHFKPTVLV